MAKPKGGLGRGLGSLLGVGMDGTIPSVPEPEKDKEESEPSAIPQTKDLETVLVSEKEAAKIVNTQVKEEIPKEEPIVIAEDNFTIKGVVEREVVPVAGKDDEKPDAEVDIEDVIPNPDQPRNSFKKEDLEELAESIKRNGLLSPILVRKYDGKYQIIAGERRWQACKLLGKKTIPIRIKEADDDEAIILALVENIQRSNLNPIEEAYGYRRMMERGKMTQSEVAQAVSKGRTTITNALRLLELPEDAQQLLFEEKITAGHARAILSVPSEEGRRKLIDKLVEEKLSVRDAERIARLLSGKRNPSTEQRPATPKSYKTVARALSDSLGTAVKIKSLKGANQIQITFKDEEDLQRLFKIISPE